MAGCVEMWIRRFSQLLEGKLIERKGESHEKRMKYHLIIMSHFTDVTAIAIQATPPQLRPH